MPTDQFKEYLLHDSSPIDTPSMAINNVDHYNTSIPYYYKKLTIESMIDSSFISLPFLPGTEILNKIPTVKNDTSSTQQSLYWIHQQSLDQICFYLYDFSQSATCIVIVTRFKECSLTLFDKLWYL